MILKSSGPLASRVWGTRGPLVFLVVRRSSVRRGHTDAPSWGPDRCPGRSDARRQRAQRRPPAEPSRRHDGPLDKGICRDVILNHAQAAGLRDFSSPGVGGIICSSHLRWYRKDRQVTAPYHRTLTDDQIHGEQIAWHRPLPSPHTELKFGSILGTPRSFQGAQRVGRRPLYGVPHRGTRKRSFSAHTENSTDQEAIGRARSAAFRYQLLNAALSEGVADAEALALAGAWREEYNHRRPHSSLEVSTPEPSRAWCSGGWGARDPSRRRTRQTRWRRGVFDASIPRPA